MKGHEPSTATMQLLSFRLSSRCFGIELGAVRRVIPAESCFGPSRTPPDAERLISIGEELVPVFDLGKRMGLEPSQRDDDASVILVGLASGSFGFVADQVAEVMRVPASSIAPPEGPDSFSEYSRGLVRAGDEPVTLLDLDRLPVSSRPAPRAGARSRRRARVRGKATPTERQLALMPGVR